VLVRDAPSCFEALSGSEVAAVAAGEKARHAAYGRDAHAGELMDLAVRQRALERTDHGPPIRHRLKFRRRAQVAEEGADFLGGLEGGKSDAQASLREGFLAGGDGAVGFHGRQNVLLRYYISMMF
jgi:hypothetical protein